MIFGIDPLLSFSLSGLIMASNSSAGGGASYDNSWVGKETLEAVSHFSADGATMIARCLIGRKEDWEILLPSVSDRICSHFSVNRIPMCEAVFREVGFRLPFFSFQVDVFNWLELCPSKLRPDSFAYMIAFEEMCRYLLLPATKELFFAIFTIQRALDKNSDYNCIISSVHDIVQGLW